MHLKQGEFLFREAAVSPLHFLNTADVIDTTVSKLSLRRLFLYITEKSEYRKL